MTEGSSPARIPAAASSPVLPLSTGGPAGAFVPVPPVPPVGSGIAGGVCVAGLGIVAIMIAALRHLGAGWPVLLVATAAVLALLLLMVLFTGIRHLGDRRQARREQLWRDMGDALGFPCFLVGQDGRASYVNRKFREIWPDDMRHPLAGLRQQLDGEAPTLRKMDRLEAAMRRGACAVEEMAGRRNGTARWFRVAVNPLGDRRTWSFWSVDDITAQRQMEAAVRQEQEKFADFLENAPVGFFSVDPRGRFRLLNRTLMEWLGTDLETLTQQDKRLHDIVAGDRDARTPAHSPFASPDTDRGEVAMHGADGTPIQTFISQTIVEDPDTGEKRTRSVVRNLTPERAFERALRRSELRLQRFFEDSPVGIALLNRDCAVVESNRAWRTLVAPGQNPPPGTPLAAFLAERHADGMIDWLRDIQAGVALEAVRRIHLRSLTETGRRREVSVHVSRIGEGLVLHFLAAGDQREVDTGFIQGQKMQAIGQLAGGIAHDFNNLLTAMIGFCDLLLLRHGPGDQSFGDIMQIKQNASRAANLVRQLLAFSRQQTLQPKVVNVTDIIAELIQLLRRLIGASIRLDVHHGQDLGLVRVDQGQLEQVIINLAVNARDAMENGGNLTIRTRNLTVDAPVRHGSETLSRGDYVVIMVTDTGHGIPPENLERIFEPFYSTKEVGQGTGLGLSTVYGIIKQTEGHLLVESTPGEGTTFSIYLPRHRESEAQPAGEEAKKEERGDLTGAGSILLVEDEDAVRQFSARALRAKGYQVLEAQSGADALDVLAQERIDLLITDVVMPEMDGPTLIRQAVAQRPDLGVICISGYAEDAFRRRIGEDSTIHFLGKPFSLAQLATRVKEVMAAL